MINEEASGLIDKLKAAGFGWGKFAESVERSGNCSQRQFETMISMVERIESHTKASRPRCPYPTVPVDYEFMDEPPSTLEQWGSLQSKIRELERQIEAERFDQMMARVNGRDDTHIGPP
jgi:hypothetical protein